MLFIYTSVIKNKPNEVNGATTVYTVCERRIRPLIYEMCLKKNPCPHCWEAIYKPCVVVLRRVSNTTQTRQIMSIWDMKEFFCLEWPSVLRCRFFAKKTETLCWSRVYWTNWFKYARCRGCAYCDCTTSFILTYLKTIWKVHTRTRAHARAHTGRTWGRESLSQGHLGNLPALKCDVQHDLKWPWRVGGAASISSHLKSEYTE